MLRNRIKNVVFKGERDFNLLRKLLRKTSETF